jgi:hypothetical protein
LDPKRKMFKELGRNYCIEAEWESFKRRNPKRVELYEKFKEFRYKSMRRHGFNREDIS